MNIAIIGGGVSGLVSAHLLCRDHEVTLFEAGRRVGGHVVTTPVESAGETLAVDAGFIVFNEANYPNFTRLLSRLGVETRPAPMSFSVRCERTGMEYAGTSLDTFFAQRSNLFRPRSYALLAEILRFHRAAARALGNGTGGTLRDFLYDHRLSRRLAELYLVPLTAAIWSTDPRRVLDMPARFILGFLDNHNLLGVNGHHSWRVVRGGSARYVERLVAPFADRIRVRMPVRRLERTAAGIAVATDAGRELFDEVVVATHSDQALALLAEPRAAEREVLGAIRYQPNPAVLHTDDSVLPARPKARAAWNYRIPRAADRPVAVTYDMNRLQSLRTSTPYRVSLNLDDEIPEERVLRRFDFRHPLFTEETVAAQARHTEISGAAGIHYCGAYWGHGFHEDGVVSALAVARRIGVGA